LRPFFRILGEAVFAPYLLRVYDFCHAALMRTLIQVKVLTAITCARSVRTCVKPVNLLAITHKTNKGDPVMGYKSIALFIANDTGLAATLDNAAALAQTHDAHLSVCCLGVDDIITSSYYGGGPAVMLQVSLDASREQADTLDAEVRRLMANRDVRWSCESAVLTSGGVGAFVGHRARFSDLVIAPRPYGKARTATDETIVEAAMFEGRVPIYVLPEPAGSATATKRIAVAWNQSDEAMTAIRSALPLLINADMVSVLIIDPPSHSPERSDPGGNLTQMLARHGVRAEVVVLAKTMPHVSDVIQRFMTEQDCDLLVMGAYGHSRMREAILGGAARDALEASTKPVFMAH
jgi:nucleotide-binding universal stress UspA family protein